MAHQQIVADVHPDELCPPNKRYDLMDANKKIDLEHVQCPPESKILTNIIKNHSLRFTIAASSFIPWIYMAEFWHTLKEDGSKYRLKFILDRKELSLTLDDFRTIFHLPQVTDNNHDSFVPPPSFYDMIPFYKNHLGFTMELKIPSSFKTTGLLQPWQTLCKIFSKCLTMLPIMTCHPPICPAATGTVPRIQLLVVIRRHVAASYWTAASDVAPTSAPADLDRVWAGFGSGLDRVWAVSGSGSGRPLDMPRVSYVCPPGIHVDADVDNRATYGSRTRCL
nr:hypothetical protein [Tanacetum cinerariifolium]